MAFILGNKMTAVFTTAATATNASFVYTFLVTGFSFKSAGRTVLALYYKIARLEYC